MFFERKVDPPADHPWIVVALVNKTTLAEDGIPSVRFSNVLLSRMEVEARLEQTVAGKRSDPGDLLSFSYFTQGRLPASSQNPIHKRLFEALPGRRYLFFLETCGGELRSVGDVGPFSIPIWTGRPDPTSFQKSDSNSLRIARLLLVPGSGFDEHEFASRLSEARSLAERWASRYELLGLLRNLLGQSPPVSQAACFEIAAQYAGWQDCLRPIQTDPVVPQAVRDAAQRVLADAAEFENHQMAALTRGYLPPTRARKPDSRRLVFEELLMYAQSPHKPLNKLAAAAIQRYYPEWRASESPSSSRNTTGKEHQRKR